MQPPDRRGSPSALDVAIGADFFRDGGVRRLLSRHAAVEITNDGYGAAPRVRAAQYVRMSTDHQRYSTENQAAAIAQYAERHGMQIVKVAAMTRSLGVKMPPAMLVQGRLQVGGEPPLVRAS